jgi:ATP phosphoribosyltransferase
MAMDLTKDSMREKIEILTSQAAVTHALDFVEKTKQEVKEQFIKSMQQIVKQDKFESAPINYAVEKSPEIQSYTGESAESLSPEQAPIRSIDQ